MSVTTLSHVCESVLAARSMHSRAGVRKAAKRLTNRANRRVAVKMTKDEALALLATPAADIENFTEEQSKAYADAMLFIAEQEAADELSQAEQVYLEFEASLEEHAMQEKGIPLNLLGALPDWMLEQIQAARGNAFDELSLFEAKSASPKARISMEDEALYA